MTPTKEEKDYLKKYKEERQLLIQQIRALSCLGYVEYIATHLNMNFAEQGYSWFYTNYILPAELHMSNPEYPYPEDMDKMLKIEAVAIARYPLIYAGELQYMPSAFSSEMDFFKNFSAPNSEDFTDFDALEDAWIKSNEELEEWLKRMMTQYKYDCMAFNGHSAEDVEEIEYIGEHGSFSTKDDKLFQEDDMSLDKIKELKKVAEDYYQNEQLWSYYPISKSDIDRILFYDRIKNALQTVTKKSSKAEEKEERQRLRKELDDFIK